jgi:hypothetical protein
MDPSSPDGPKTKAYVRYIHEVLFSLNVAAAFVLVRVITRSPNAFPNSIFMRVKYAVDHLFHTYYESNLSGNVALWVTTFLFALPMFLLLRLLARTSVMKGVLRTVAGMAALVGWPSFWFYTSGAGFVMSWRLRALLEVEISVICALLYLYGKWPLPRWASVLLLTAHCVFWCWYYFHTFPLSGLLFPLFGLASTLAWSSWVSDQRARRTSQVSVA